jgi:hypothetical protein
LGEPSGGDERPHSADYQFAPSQKAVHRAPHRSGELRGRHASL